MMAQIVKKLSAPYVLVAANAAPTTFTVGRESTNNAEVVINGNLTVRGNSVVVDTIVTTVTDNILTLNKDNSAQLHFAGIEVDRGAGNFIPQIVWSEDAQAWLLDKGNGYEIISTQLGTAYLTRVKDDLTPELGGNLHVGGFKITANNNLVLQPGQYTQLDSAIQVKDVADPPTSIPGYNLVFAAAPAGGGTGLFVTNTTVTKQELVSKRRAIVYSLIF
jgi:hypothetical protein